MLRGLVALVEDDEDQRLLLSRWFENAGLEVEPVEDAEGLFAALQTTVPDVICLDLELPGMSGIEALTRCMRTHPGIPVVITTAHRDVDVVVDAMQRGAYDYLAKPLDKTKLLTVLKNALEKRELGAKLKEYERQNQANPAGMIGDSNPMRSLYRQIDQVAPTDVTVLIRGESGTGKELIAKALHEESTRRDGPFVALNCAAIPETLQESELFGHEKGAFTGAEKLRRGCFERADSGTLFLDEVAELSSSLQAKLLRVLQERSFHRVGGEAILRSDFRVIAASHQDLFAKVAEGAFRQDLFFRLAVFELDVPPLRSRGEDVVELARSFLSHQNESLSLGPSAVQLLKDYGWPGNVRELQNAVQRAAVVRAEGEVIAEDFPSRIRANADAAPAVEAPAVNMEELEKRALQDALERCGGNITEVVRQLGIGRTTVYRKLKKYGLRD